MKRLTLGQGFGSFRVIVTTPAATAPASTMSRAIKMNVRVDTAAVLTGSADR